MNMEIIVVIFVPEIKYTYIYQAKSIYSISSKTTNKYKKTSTVICFIILRRLATDSNKYILYFTQWSKRLHGLRGPYGSLESNFSILKLYNIHRRRVLKVGLAILFIAIYSSIGIRISDNVEDPADF